MAVYQLTAYVDADLEFGRGETPAFRLDFTGVDEDTVAGWTVVAPIRKAPLHDPFAEWDVVTDGLSLFFSLDAETTTTLPDNTIYSIAITASPTTTHVPMGGRLILRRSQTP